MIKVKFNVEFELTAAELVDIEFEISVSGIVSDAHIIAEVSGRDSDNDIGDDDSDNEEPTDTLTKPDFKDVMNAISILRNACLPNVEPIWGKPLATQAVSLIWTIYQTRNKIEHFCSNI